MSAARPFRRIAIVGTGLIGASLGLALLRSSTKRDGMSVVGFDADPRASRAALRQGAILERACALEDAVIDADLVVLATPLGEILKDLRRAILAAKRGALIVEVGPVKTPAVAAAARALKSRGDLLFAACHPMAGRERAGSSGSTAELFVDKPFVIVVPPQRDRTSAKRLALALAHRLRAIPISLTAQAHDRLAAAYSALPQLASVALAVAADTVDHRGRPFRGRPRRKIAGTGYRDATRLALSPFEIWRPALTKNRRNVLRSLRALERAVSALRTALEGGDIDAVERIFAHASAARRRSIAE